MINIVAAVLLLFILSAPAFAELRITVRGQAPYVNKQLKVYLDENIYYGGKNKIEFAAGGLEPRGIYTVWLENGSKSKGLGDSPYSFMADSSGKAIYSAAVEAHKLKDWQFIKVSYHSDGVAENLAGANLVTIFLIDIDEFLLQKELSAEGESLIAPKISIYRGLLKQGH